MNNEYDVMMWIGVPEGRNMNNPGCNPGDTGGGIGRNPAVTCGTPSGMILVDAGVCGVNSDDILFDARQCGVNSDSVGSLPQRG